MKNNLNSVWQKSTPTKIKQRGGLALATFAISNNNKLQSMDNRYIWPTSFAASTPKSMIKKDWKF